jgi:orotidine-5'-phosphate decarboxylase
MIPIFVAVDTPSRLAARDLLHKVGDLVHVKFGLEFIYANSLDHCHELRDVGCSPNHHRQLFADLKIHDIPRTDGGAVRSAMRIEPDFITVHTCDGVEPLQFAVKAANEEAIEKGLKRPKLLGVTVLTSVKMDRYDFRNLVTERATHAFFAGLDGLVCAASEVAYLRNSFAARWGWHDMFLMVPGIRAEGAETQDQEHVGTAREVMDAGADAEVIGTEITNNPDPHQATLNIIETLK